MTNRFNNWERLAKVIARFGLSVNSFSRVIGLTRSENLYHIRKGNYGISLDLANRILDKDSDVDRAWLLSGVGNMLKSEPLTGESLPFFRDEMEDVLPHLERYKPAGYIHMPYVTGAGLMVRTFTRSMSDPMTAANDLLLKRLLNTDEVVQGNEHVMLVGDEIIWRRVRYVKGDSQKWRLVARNREEFPDIVIDASEVKAVWRVIARLAILES